MLDSDPSSKFLGMPMLLCDLWVHIAIQVIRE